MLLRNMDSPSGLCNGTRLIIRQLHDNCIAGEIIGSTYAGSVHLIPRVTLSPSDTSSMVKMSRLQFPVRLGYAMTVNKAQGQTLDKVGLFLRDPCFSHGQLYVAMSRVRSPANIRVSIARSSEGQDVLQDGTAFTRNVVYHEVL